MTQPPSLAKALRGFVLGRLGAGATGLAWLASGLGAATAQTTPTDLPLTHCSKSFQVTLPPYSVKVLRIQAK